MLPTAHFWWTAKLYHPIGDFFCGCVGAWVRVRKLDRSTEYINYQPSPEYSCTDFSLR